MNRKRPEIKLAFFDVDGVIVDSFLSIFRSTNDFLQFYGLPAVNEQKFRIAMDGQSRWIDSMKKWGMHNYNPTIHNRILENFIWDRLPECQGFPKAVTILRTIRERGVPIHLISACSKGVTFQKLFNIWGVEVIDIVNCKIYGTEQKAVCMMDICSHCHIPPTSCLLVADMPRDFHEGQTAGVGCKIGVASQFSTPESLAPYCDQLVHNHDELLSHLCELLGSV